MLNKSEFRYQRHLEIWLDQNKHIKRVVLATLIFGFLILIRVLIPLNDKTLRIHDQVIGIHTKINNLEKTNESLSKLEYSLSKVEKFIQARPWEKEKQSLIQKFRNLNFQNQNVNPQKVADESIKLIVNNLNASVIEPLDNIFPKDSSVAEFLPEIRGDIEEFRSFIRNWEVNHVGRNWFGTISEKNEEMYNLTHDLNQRTNRFSEILNSKLNIIGQEIGRQKEYIVDLNKNVTDIQDRLEATLEDILPNWLQGIMQVRHMVQFYPFLLLIMVLYASWLITSIAKHYSFVKNHIKLEKEDLSDIAAASIWTLTMKSRLGITLTIMTYGLFLIIVWILFEYGWHIFDQWASVTDSSILLFNFPSMRFGIWSGRILFALLLLGIIFYRQIPAFQKMLEDSEE